MTAAEDALPVRSWRCLLCDVRNAPEDDACLVCETDRGTATDAGTLIPSPPRPRGDATPRAPGPQRRPHPVTGPRSTVPGPAVLPRALAAGPAAPRVAPPTGEVFFPVAGGHPPVPPHTGRPPMPPLHVRPHYPPRAYPPPPGPPRPGPPFPAPRPPWPPPFGPGRPWWNDRAKAHAVGLGCAGLLIAYFLLVACVSAIGSSSGGGY
ncbi:hypothetical protein Acsp03_01140 [Actinomadura sp. NBRC 104412]|uniref:hypothetical protein n=1 Tax=Actinomadura sp. NBRC 104412 TaxID=3032203 RepID=UPI0024A3C520|nr:hypothetical protein [Actinomadura sp. NBRC 104412]GLZ02647.1 hypothetical protein Acsp03_01140 [Actinomadura sp. NBRC 104412]